MVFMMAPLSTLMSAAALAGLVFMMGYEALPVPMSTEALPGLPAPSRVTTTALAPAGEPQVRELAEADALSASIFQN
jgi:hypothetical protein